MKFHSVRIYCFGTVAGNHEIKSIAVFLDEGFYPTVFTIKLDALICLYIHICDNKCIYVSVAHNVSNYMNRHCFVNIMLCVFALLIHWKEEKKMKESKLIEFIEGKNILFVTTKNIDYIRNTQELRILYKYAKNVDELYSLKKNNLLRIIEIWLRLSKKRVEQADIIFIGFEPQFVLPLKKNVLKGKRIVVDFFISVYDTLVWDREIIKDKTVFARFCHKIDDITLHRADLIITDTKAHKEYFLEEFKGKNKLFETIYLEADSSIYYQRPQNKPEEVKDKFIVLYFGSILPLQGVDIVLDAIEALKDYDDIFFDVIGPIPEKYHKPNQENVHYTDWLSQEELAKHIANADLCLAGHFNSKIEKAKRTIPGKAYIYEIMQRPMILGDNKANQELFVEDSNHFFVNMSDAECLVKKILFVKERKE